MNHFDLDENKEYTFSEIIGMVRRALLGMTVSQWDVTGADTVNSTLDAKGVETLISGIIGYMNDNMPGTFELVQTEKGVYRIQYIPEGILN